MGANTEGHRALKRLTEDCRTLLLDHDRHDMMTTPNDEVGIIFSRSGKDFRDQARASLEAKGRMSRKGSLVNCLVGLAAQEVTGM